MQIFDKLHAVFEAFSIKKVGTPREIESNLYNFQEELDELALAVEGDDLEETADALCDLIVFCAQEAYRLNIDLEDKLHGVADSQFLKLCKTDEELITTLHHYLDIGVIAYYEMNPAGAVVVKSLVEQTDKSGKKYTKDKVLKNVVRFVPPQNCKGV